MSPEVHQDRLPLPPDLRNGTGTNCISWREAELQSLKTLFDAARLRHRQLVFVSGDAGIGKTTLAFSFAHSLAGEVDILLGRCESKALMPFKPFVEVLEWIVESWPPATLQHVLSGIDGSHELAQLVPSIGKHVIADAEGLELTADGRRYRMFDAFTRLLKSVAESGPVLLILDDFHVADAGSMLLLRQLIRYTQDSALCIIVTLRDAELQQDAWCRELWPTLRRDPSATHIALAGLGEEHISALVYFVYANRPRPIARPPAREHHGRKSPVCHRVVAPRHKKQQFGANR